MRKLLFVLATLLLTYTTAYAGNVSGNVHFTGTAPERTPIDMGADPSCSKAGAALSEDVLVGENGALQNVFVFVKAGLEGQTFTAPTEKVILDQKGCRYEPRVFGIQVGQPLEIMNTDPTLHNVHGMPKNSKEFNLGMPIQGMKLKRIFDTPETMIKFKCDVHPWMRAYAGVMTHPFFAVTGADGSFTIENLPAGEYTLEAWHETFGVQTQTITVTDEVATADFSFSGE